MPVPALSDGESQLDDGDLGALTLFFLLSSQHDALVALEAADGWGGDAYVTFERDDRVCMRVSVASVDDRAARELERLLQEWGDASPARERRGDSRRSDGDLRVVRSGLGERGA